MSFPSPNTALISSGFIYAGEGYPQCHASTIVETRSGDLVAAWFGGTAESNPDVSIYVSRLENGRWSPGKKVAEGFEANGDRTPTWNPVLFLPREGPLYLFYKVGPTCETWWGIQLASHNEGRDWIEPRRLPPGIFGPIKNKPVLLDEGTIISGSSTETDSGWRVQIERSTDNGVTWNLSAPIPSHKGYNAIQPAILVRPGGGLQMLCRTKEMVLVTSRSSDHGKTWDELDATTLLNPNSGIDAITLADGRHLLVHNPRFRAMNPVNPKFIALGGAQQKIPEASEDWGVRWPLGISISSDGINWNLVATLESLPCLHGYAYPAVIQTRDGLVHVTYSFNREKIKHVVLDPKLI